MTRIIAVNENNDWFINDKKNLSISTGLQAVLEQCEHVMKTRIGELVFNIQRGVISLDVGGNFGNAPDLLLFDSRARRALLGVADVIGITSLDAEIIEDTLEYNAVIETIYGTDSLIGAIDLNL